MQTTEVFNSLFDKGPVVVFVWRNLPDWPVEFVSKNVEHFYGYSPEDYVQGRIRYTDHLHPDDIVRIVQEVEAASQNPTMDRIEHELYRYCDASGHYRWVKDSKHLERNSAGEVVRFIGYLVDVSNQIQLQAQTVLLQERLDLAWNAINDGLWDWSIAENQVYFSPRWKQMLGYEPQEFEDSFESFLKAVHPHDRANLQRLLALHFSDPENIPYDAEIRLQCKNGDYKWIRTRGKVSLDAKGSAVRMLGSHTEIDYAKRQAESISLLERRYQSMFNDHDAVMLLLEPRTGQIIDANKSAQDFYGYSHKEFLSLKIEQINMLSPEKISHLREAALLRNKNSFIFPHRLKNGEIRSVEVHASPIESEAGPLIFTIIRDVTIAQENEEKLGRLTRQIEEERKRYKALMENAPDGVFIMDTQGALFESNQAAAKMLGYTPDELRRLNVFDWDVGIDPETLPEFILSIGEEPIKFETAHRRKDGSTYDAEITAVKIKLGEHAYLYASVRDITQEIQLRKALIEAKVIAENAANAKSEFLANMSHEIRTPLNGIIGLNNLLLKTPLDDMQKDYLKKSLQSSRALLGVINDILDYSKIEAGKLELSLQEFSLEDMLRTVADLFDYSLIEKQLEIHIDLDPKIPNLVKADSLRITQVLNNLVGNAVKFTRQGDIVMRCIAKPKNQAFWIEFSVSDSGIGMTADEQKKLFKPFSQTDSSNTRKYGGTGLGLVIVRQLVSLMGGEIGLQSEKGKGSTFTFAIPVEQVAQTSQAFKTDHYRSKRFLVVDDNAIERMTIKHILTSWGIEPIVCADGREALEYASQHPVDFLLVDWLMPGLDGLDVIEQLKISQPQAFPKVVMISAMMQDELREKAHSRNLFPDKILHKPVTPSILMEALFEDAHLRPKLAQLSEKFVFEGKVLVAEDNEINQLVIRDSLTMMGITVSLVENGQQAVEKALTQTFDLVLMDLQMPVMDGFTAAREIRQQNAHLPIVALSAAVMQHDKELTVSAGMNDHLAKPINLKELQAVLKKYLVVKPAKPSQVGHPDALFEIYGIDGKKLQGLYQDSQSILKLLKIFHQHLLGFSQHLNDLPIDSQQLATVMHTLKGVSGNVYAQEIFKLARRYEEEESLAQRESIKMRLLHEIQLTANAIAEILPAGKVVEANQEVSVENILESIAAILQKLESNSFIDDQKLREFISMIQGVAEESYVESIADAIDGFDFGKAIQLLNALKESL